MKGDEIDVFEKMEDGWWVGEINGKRVHIRSRVCLSEF